MPEHKELAKTICTVEQLERYVGRFDEEAKLKQVTQIHPMRISPYYMSLINWDDPHDPIKKIAAPRLLTLLVMVPVLTIVCDTVAILGGWVVGVFIANVTTTMYWANVKLKLNFGNMLMGLLKPFVFSLCIAFVSCYKGFSSEGGTKGVGRATTNSVVMASILILIINFFITKVLGSAIEGYL